MDTGNQAIPPAITIYSSPTCVYCHMAMEYFDSLGLTYTEKDITADAEAFAYVVEKIGQAVTPIVTINDTIIVGFDRPKIDDALQDARTARN